ncbi:MAG: hypothetical protein ACYC6F_05070 [Longimicrobiales bacterium]
MIATTDRSPKHRLRALALAVTLAAASCVGDASAPPAQDGLDRETFISTYVDLRAVTIRGDSFAISDVQRAEVLARHGVTEDALLGFAELHGEDVPFMRSVWDEVESRLDDLRIEPR